MKKRDKQYIESDPELRKVFETYQKQVEKSAAQNPRNSKLKEQWDKVINVGEEDEIRLGDRFWLNITPRMVALISGGNTKADLAEGKITLKQSFKRSLGQDTHARLNHIIVNSSLILGADPNSKNSGIVALGPGVLKDGIPSFHGVIDLNSFQLTKMLLNRGTQTDNPCCYGSYPIHYAFDNRFVADDRKLKSDSQKMINEYERFNATGIRNIVLNRTKDVNLKDSNGKTALHIAVASPWVDGTKGVEMLLKRGANINWQDKNGNTPLHIAAQKGTPEILESLLRANAKDFLQNKQGDTAYAVAIKSNRKDMENKFVELGANRIIENVPVDFNNHFGKNFQGNHGQLSRN